jgi:uncharacterized protein YnzC (UPF0291/DUF896 family)
MATLDIFALANKKAKGKRPNFLDDPAIERVLSITLAVAGELAVMRERMDTIERLLQNGQPVTREAIDQFQPSMEEARERAMWQQEYLSRIFRIVQQELEALESDDTSSEELSSELAEP